MRLIVQKREIKIKQRNKVIKFLIGSILLLLGFLSAWELYPRTNIHDGVLVMGLSFLPLVPAFLTDALMPVVANIPKIKRYPIDGGRVHKDGSRILGEGKSWNGFILGTLAGFGLSVLIFHFIFPYLYNLTEHLFADGKTILMYMENEEKLLSFFGIYKHPVKYYLGQFFIALSAPVGDLIGSYYKRRKKVGRGEVFLFWDQNDFILLGGLVAWAFFPFTWYHYVFLILMTPILTILFSLLGYLVGLKTHPW